MSRFKVQDMTCSHCEKAIQKELTKHHPEASVQVNLKDKTINVQNLPDEQVILLLKEIGYTPQKWNNIDRTT